MSKSLVRMVGGPAAGREIWHDPEKQGPVMECMVRPDFPIGAVTEDMAVTATFETVIYHIHLVRYDTNGHRHYYAAPARRQLVDLMNEMWDGYRKSEGQS